MRVLHLGERVAEHSIGGDGLADLGELPPGGYGVEVRVRGAAGGLQRVSGRSGADGGRGGRGGTGGRRYGFVADYLPGRDIAGVIDNVRRYT